MVSLKKNENERLDAESLAAEVIGGRLSIRDAGSRLGWADSKSYRIAGSPAYREIYASRVLEIANQVSSMSVTACQTAFSTLCNLMQNSSSDNIKLDASKAVIGHFSKVVEVASQQLASARLEQQPPKQPSGGGDLPNDDLPFDMLRAFAAARLAQIQSESTDPEHADLY